MSSRRSEGSILTPLPTAGIYSSRRGKAAAHTLTRFVVDASAVLALTQLQADAFVTLDAELARSVDGIVRTASIDALG